MDRPAISGSVGGKKHKCELVIAFAGTVGASLLGVCSFPATTNPSAKHANASNCSVFLSINQVVVPWEGKITAIYHKHRF